MTNSTITRSLSDHGCAWHGYDRSDDRGRIVMPAFLRTAELGQAAFVTAAAVAISPATKRHPGTLVWSPPT